MNLTEEQVLAIEKAYKILADAGLDKAQIGTPYPKPRP